MQSNELLNKYPMQEDIGQQSVLVDWNDSTELNNLLRKDAQTSGNGIFSPDENAGIYKVMASILAGTYVEPPSVTDDIRAFIHEFKEIIGNPTEGQLEALGVSIGLSLDDVKAILGGVIEKPEFVQAFLDDGELNKEKGDIEKDGVDISGEEENNALGTNKMQETYVDGTPDKQNHVYKLTVNDGTTETPQDQELLIDDLAVAANVLK